MNCEIALLKKEGTHSNFSQLDDSSNSAISVKSKGLTNRGGAGTAGNYFEAL